MNPRAELLFHEVADLSPAERDVYFRDRLVPPELRAEVEQLLHFDSATDDSLVAAVAAEAERILQPAIPAAQNRRCGPYRLVRILGRGGMGAVWLAERADGEVEQRVAIKFLRYASDEPAFIDRFLRERQILAQLNHPGIARLLDAGHTEEGEPYLAMDYIDGVHIEAYARELDVRRKLRLFIRVCDAVSYLHRNLIIHRDLKPSNILVDRAGEPKLLDFGIAKILDAAADQTHTHERLLTPEYASPEQIQGAPQTTATDVYSLGAVLRKLLADASPPADLQCIWQKAMRAEPEERYASADALAGDVRAFLESRPVRARSGAPWYRARKFLRRYWAAVAAAALVVASLSAGLYVANRERVLAQKRFQQVRQLSNKVLALDPLVRELPGSTKAREEIVAMSQAYLQALRPDAYGDQDLALELAGAYIELARAQGVPLRTNLGQTAAAAESLRNADGLLQAILGGSPQNQRALFLYAKVAHDRMILAGNARRWEESLAQAQKAAAALDKAVALGKMSEADARMAAAMYFNIALYHKNLHRYQDAVSYARRASRTAPSKRAPVVGNALSIIADSLRLSGDLDGALQNIQEARGMAENSQFTGEFERRTVLGAILWREGVILGQDGGISLGRSAAAAAALQKDFDLMEEWAERDPNDAGSRTRLAIAAVELGMILRHGDPRRAIEVFDRALFRLSEIKQVNALARNNRIKLLLGSAYPLRGLHRYAEARQRIDQAFLLLRRAGQYPAEHLDPDDEAYFALQALGDHLADTGQPQRAEQVYRELLQKTVFNPDPSQDLAYATDLSQVYQSLADVDRRVDNLRSAAAFDARRVELWRTWDRKLPNNPFVLRQIAAAAVR